MKKIVLIAYIVVVSISSVFAGPLFDKFREKQQQELIDFGNEHLQHVGGHVFYPFGGPDVTYPLLMFPNFKVLTLVGLESAKLIKNYPVSLDNGSLSNLSSLYKRSFFITDQMASKAINVTALILKQLENLGASDVSISEIKDRQNAIEIKFFYNGKNRIIRYYKAGLDNKQINIKFLESLEPFDVVLFKAASYLPHQKSFSKFRKFVLNNCDTFVQDSTGIPYEYLKKGFDLNLHGKYLMPYKFPGGFEQVSFRKYSEKLNNETLNICFGYGCKKVPTNILIATRKEQNIL